MIQNINDILKKIQSKNFYFELQKYSYELFMIKVRTESEYLEIEFPYFNDLRYDNIEVEVFNKVSESKVFNDLFKDENLSVIKLDDLIEKLENNELYFEIKYFSDIFIEVRVPGEYWNFIFDKNVIKINLFRSTSYILDGNILKKYIN